MRKFFEKSEKRAFLFHEAFASFGESMIGIFFPFLLMEAFGLSVSEVLYWMAGLFLLFSILVLPVYKIFSHWNLKSFLQLGVVFGVLFYGFLAFAPDASWSIYVAVGLHALGYVFYWPAYNWTLTHTTKDGGRGGILAWIQILNVAMGMVAPLVTGYFFSIGHQDWIIFVTMFFFLFGLWVLQFLPDRECYIPTFNETKKVLKDHFFTKKSFKGHFVDAIQSRTLWVPWPLFLKLSLPGYIALGGVQALSSVSEIITSRFSGKWMDSHSAKEVMKVGIWARFFDIGTRSLLFFIPTIWMASIASILAGALGPMFNVSMMGRVLEHSEDMPEEDMLAFYIAREWFLGFWSVLIFVFAGLGYSFFGIAIFAVLLVIAAFMSFLVRGF